MIGAHVEGFAAHVVDRLLVDRLPRLLPGMDTAQRRAVQRAHQQIAEAAAHWEALTSAGGSAEVLFAEVGASSPEELDVPAAALVLGVSERRVRQIAAAWEGEGTARKVGRSWHLDRLAVFLYSQRATSTNGDRR